MAPIEQWGTISRKDWEKISQSIPVRGKKAGMRAPKDEITEVAQRAAGLGLGGSPTEYVFGGDEVQMEAFTFANKVRALGKGQLRVVKESDESVGQVTVYIGPAEVK